MANENSYILVTNPKQPWIKGYACCNDVYVQWAPMGDEAEGDGYDIYFGETLDRSLVFDESGNLENTSASNPTLDFASLANSKIIGTTLFPQRWIYGYKRTAVVGGFGDAYKITVVETVQGVPSGRKSVFYGTVDCEGSCGGSGLLTQCFGNDGNVLRWRDPTGVNNGRITLIGSCENTYETMLEADNCLAFLGGDLLNPQSSNSWDVFAYYVDDEDNPYSGNPVTIATVNFVPGSCVIVEDVSNTFLIPTVQDTIYALDQIFFGSVSFSSCFNEGDQIREATLIII